VINVYVTRCGATATAIMLDDFKALQEDGKVEVKPDITPGAY
jgi:hypothetical protein